MRIWEYHFVGYTGVCVCFNYGYKIEYMHYHMKSLLKLALLSKTEVKYNKLGQGDPRAKVVNRTCPDSVISKPPISAVKALYHLRRLK